MEIDWKNRALQVLIKSLTPIPHETSELDWKSGLSTKTDRLAQHVCAFCNRQGGGMFAFGINNDATFITLSPTDVDTIITQLGNIARNNLSQAVEIDHTIIDYEGHPILFIYVPEQREKPIYWRGGKDGRYTAYCRNGDQTIKMSDLQVHNLIATSQGITFEERIAKTHLTPQEVLSLLNYRKFFELIDKSIPTNVVRILERMEEYELCTLCNKSDNLWGITNLGALLFANDLSNFNSIETKKVIVRKYVGSNNRTLLVEQQGKYGYAVGFEGLIDFIMKYTSVEDIKEIQRGYITQYPIVAIREFVANALVHQDLSVTEIQTTIEIFSNRLVITNPGASLNDVNRLIDLQPKTRNKKLAQLMFQLKFCEQRGSGVDRAIEAIEKDHLPAPKIINEGDFTQVKLFPYKSLSEMTKQEKIEACYLHACLLQEDNKAMNNLSLRERFNLNDKQSFIVSRIINDTLEAGLIKVADANVTSRKFATYIPYYA